MQFPTLLATLLLFTTTSNTDGYGHQQTSLQQNNRPSPVYGPAPLSPPVSVPCTEHTSAPAATQVPVLTAFVRALEPSGRNYEVKLSQSNHLNLIHAQPLQHAAINGPHTYYTNNHQPASTSGRYLPPTIPSQPRPHQQAFHGVPDQQHGNSATGSHSSYTAHQNPLLTPQYTQRSPPTSLTPPPPQSQYFSHHGNLQQQQPSIGVPLGSQHQQQQLAGLPLSNQQQQQPSVGIPLGNQQQQQQLAGLPLSNQQQQQPSVGVPLGNQQQQQPFAGVPSGNQHQQQPFAGVQLGNQQSNRGISGIAPKSQFSSATKSGSAFTNSGSTQGVPGNYISQSEVGQLDHYFEKQNPVGDTRAFTRIISTCYPDGHCEQQQLGADQVDQRHQHVVLTARARVQPISDKCRALSSTGTMAPISVGSVSVGSAAQNSMQRPPNRRLYPYNEVVIPRDPFN